MNRRKLFGMLAALPVAMAVAAKARVPLGWWQPGQYVPIMRETGQWTLGGVHYDEGEDESYSIPDRYVVRHDIAFMDQNGQNNQWGVDHSFGDEPTEEELVQAREESRYKFQRMRLPQKAYHSEYGWSARARGPIIPVGPSTTFKLALPRGIKLARYV
jgi:hypothetical protein